MATKAMQMESLGKCPCGGEIRAETIITFSVTHTAPPCREFLELEPDEFLAYVRRSRGISDAEAGN